MCLAQSFLSLLRIDFPEQSSSESDNGHWVISIPPRGQFTTRAARRTLLSRVNISPTTIYGETGHVYRCIFGSTHRNHHSFPSVRQPVPDLVQPPFRTYFLLLLLYRERGRSSCLGICRFVAKHGCIHEKWHTQQFRLEEYPKT